MLGIIEGPAPGVGRNFPLTLAGLLGGAVALVAFVVSGLRTTDPLLDPRLFRNRAFAAGSVSVFLQFLAMMGFFFITLQYLQLVLGYGTLKSALAIVPLAVAMMPASTAAARLSARFGGRRVGAFGLGSDRRRVRVAGPADRHQLLPEPSLVGMLLVGVGLGLGMTPATNAIVESLPRAKQGLASAVNDTSRELGAAFGIAIIGSAFTAGYRSHIGGRLTGVSPAQVAERGQAGARRRPSGRRPARTERPGPRPQRQIRLHERTARRPAHRRRRPGRRCRLPPAWGTAGARRRPGRSGRGRR